MSRGNTSQKRRRCSHDEQTSRTNEAQMGKNARRRSSRVRKSTGPAYKSSSFEPLDNAEARAIRDALRASHVTALKEPSLSDIPEAPVYRPSEEEFSDPIAFVQAIRERAEGAGICRVVPPKSWRPPKRRNDSKTFRTRRQAIHRLQEAVGFEDGREYNVRDYKEQADAFFQRWFGAEKLSDEKFLTRVENSFWEIVGANRRGVAVDVEYGNDIDSGSFGSCFPSSGSSPYVKHPWNLLNFAKLPGSMIASIDDSISGVNAPWVYFGMLFSSFCWHAEDLWMYSVNYMHDGAPKTWYGCPGSHLDQLQETMQQQLPELFRVEPDLMLKLVTMLSPTLLMASGIPVYRCHQYPGDFIITFPRAYHAGFNNGFNCTEAVNFAPADWFSHGLAAVEEYRKHKRPSVFPPDQLLLDVILHLQKAKANASTDPRHNMGAGLSVGLQKLIEMEQRWRDKLCALGLKTSQWKRLSSNISTTKLPPKCHICHQFCYLSFVRCRCSPRRVACLQHANHTCECDWTLATAFYRFDLQQLSALYALLPT